MISRLEFQSFSGPCILCFFSLGEGWGGAYLKEGANSSIYGKSTLQAPYHSWQLAVVSLGLVEVPYEGGLPWEGSQKGVLEQAVGAAVVEVVAEV